MRRVKLTLQTAKATKLKADDEIAIRGIADEWGVDTADSPQHNKMLRVLGKKFGFKKKQ